MTRWKNIIIHHSLTPDNDLLSWGAIRHYHVNIMRWEDIGYHFGIERIRGGYEILKGRPLTLMGAHTKGKNGDSIGICVVGNFDKTRPKKIIYLKAAELIKELMEIHHIKKENVYGHNNFSEKTCPGLQFDMNYLRSLL